jgi:two-component system LytT family response regulator
MRIPTVIIEDDKHCREALTVQLERYCPEIKIAGFASGIKSGIKIIEKKTPKLVFLDINLEDGIGFDLLEQLQNRDSFQVIIVTACPDYAPEAFQFGAIDYLYKPIDPDLLIKAVEKTKRIEEKRKADLLQNIDRGQERIGFVGNDELIFANIQEIVRGEADGNCTKVFLKDRKPVTVTYTLARFEEKVNDGKQFYRVHRAHLINLGFVERYLQKEEIVVMKDGSKVEVSRNNRPGFLDKFKR